MDGKKLFYSTGTDGKDYPQEGQPEYLTFGRERETYMRRHLPEMYQELVVAGQLNVYLNDVEQCAEKELDQLVESMAKQDGTDETLKARDPMKWTGLMNNYRHCAAEMVRQDWVYN